MRRRIANKAKIVRMYNNGMAAKEIAEELGYDSKEGVVVVIRDWNQGRFGFTEDDLRYLLSVYNDDTAKRKKRDELKEKIRKLEEQLKALEA